MTRFLPRLWRRLRTDPPFAILSLMGVFGVLGVFPFIVYRVLEGNYVVAITDSLMVLTTIGSMIYAWITHDTTKASIILVYVFFLVALAVSISVGIVGVFWFYPMILANFFLAPPRLAMPASVACLTVLTAYSLVFPGEIFENNRQLVSFLVTSVMAAILTYIFATRTRTQQEQLKLLAIQDPLTGARNRRAMNDDLQLVGARQKRHQLPQALLVMDLDHFKQINDTYGLTSGDQVLIDFVALVKRSTRSSDMLYRFGGEEFLLLLPDTDLPGLRQAAHNLQQRIRQQLAGPGGGVTRKLRSGTVNPQARPIWLGTARLKRAATPEAAARMRRPITTPTFMRWSATSVSPWMTCRWSHQASAASSTAAAARTT